MQKQNYQKLLDKEIEGLGETTPSLLLHCCCAPCSSYVLEYLADYFSITVFFYNPNLFPRDEYYKRKEELIRFIGEMPFKNPVRYLDCDYRHEEFLELCGGFADDPEGGRRCALCFRQRLSATAKAAADGGFDCFTTTLTISPLKNAEVLNSIGQKCADEYGSRWLPSDFKKKGGYQRSIVLSKEHGLYRQDYCGCEFSIRSNSDE